jgi:hypothetical protein
VSNDERTGVHVPDRRRRNGVVGTSAVALSVALLAACGGSDVGAVDGPVLTSPPGPGDGGMAAEVRGTVEIRDGCVLLVLEDIPGAPAYPVVWPAGTTWQPDPPAVVLEGDRPLEPGTSVTGAGGYLQRDAIEQVAGSAVADAAEACAGETGEIALFNVGSDVRVP